MSVWGVESTVLLPNPSHYHAHGVSHLHFCIFGFSIGWSSWKRWSRWEKVRTLIMKGSKKSKFSFKYVFSIVESINYFRRWSYLKVRKSKLKYLGLEHKNSFMLWAKKSICIQGVPKMESESKAQNITSMLSQQLPSYPHLLEGDRDRPDQQLPEKQ